MREFFFVGVCFDYILLPLKLRLIASEWAEAPFYLEYQ